MEAALITAIAKHLSVGPNQVKSITELAYVWCVVVHGKRARFVSKKRVKQMFTGNIEFVQGQESHTSNWGKFYVKGLEEYQVKEDDDRNCHDKHHSYQCHVANDIPEGTLFSVFVQDGNKRGTDTYEFYVCKISEHVEAISNSYTGCDVTGNFEIVAKGVTKTKAPRLMKWWIDGPKTMEFAEICARSINKRGCKVPA